MSKMVGSSLRSLFEELNEADELDLLTRKKVLADQVAASMKRKHLTKQKLADAMHTSRTVVYRLLDPTDTGITIETLAKVSRALDLNLNISLDPRKKSKGSGRAKTAAEKVSLSKPRHVGEVCFASQR